jgi:hypothetical protein
MNKHGNVFMGKTKKMKYIIKESQVKNLIKKYFKKDLSRNIEMITSYWDLPILFRRMMGRNAANHYLNVFGPMYLFTIDGEQYLAQDRIEKWTIADSGDIGISEDELMSLLGIYPLGLSMQELVDAYIDE